MDCNRAIAMRHSRTMSATRIPRAGLILLGLLSLGWGLNWPIMKVVITEIPRWIFRGDAILLAAAGLFGVAWFSGQSLKVPRGRWPQLIGMASCNIVGWEHVRNLGREPAAFGAGSDSWLHHAGLERLALGLAAR